MPEGDTRNWMTKLARQLTTAVLFGWDEKKSGVNEI